MEPTEHTPICASRMSCTVMHSDGKCGGFACNCQTTSQPMERDESVPPPSNLTDKEYSQAIGKLATIAGETPMEREEWRKTLRSMATKVHQGELRHGIYGDLHDPKKLESFIESLLSHTREEAIREGQERAVNYLMVNGTKTENPQWDSQTGEPYDCSFYQIYTGNLEKACTLPPEITLN